MADMGRIAPSPQHKLRQSDRLDAENPLALAFPYIIFINSLRLELDSGSDIVFVGICIELVSCIKKCARIGVIDLSLGRLNWLHIEIGHQTIGSGEALISRSSSTALLCWFNHCAPMTSKSGT